MAQYGQQTVVVVQQPSFGETPVQTTCPNCHNTVVTTVDKKAGLFAYLMALIICLLFCPCFWIPLVMDSCKDTEHTCPSCNAQLGTSKRL
ncbi:lipopolysaccharide-induced tumor necrosis factor-alpha factor homolog [Tachypleus tridentatus]|uniref:lipopolysaccharide-induced tumor necrosis factor-alpha factor homolog n=1 Tax=Tachypleus tridentatus TaxID=6853 RepID=UPI003FD58F79